MLLEIVPMACDWAVSADTPVKSDPNSDMISSFKNINSSKVIRSKKSFWDLG
jgi:hypothetical protein